MKVDRSLSTKLHKIVMSITNTSPLCCYDVVRGPQLLSFETIEKDMVFILDGPLSHTFCSPLVCVPTFQFNF